MMVRHVFILFAKPVANPYMTAKELLISLFQYRRIKKLPLRFYHKGPCASAGEDRRAKEMWGCWNLDDFVASLLNGELPEMIKLFTGIR